MLFRDFSLTGPAVVDGRGPTGELSRFELFPARTPSKSASSVDEADDGFTFELHPSAAAMDPSPASYDLLSDSLHGQAVHDLDGDDDFLLALLDN